MKVRVRRASTELKKFFKTLPEGKTLNKEQLLATYTEYRKNGTHKEQNVPDRFMAEVNRIRRVSESNKAVVYIRNGRPVAITAETYLSWIKCAKVALAGRVKLFGKKVKRGRKAGFKNPNCWILKLTKEQRSALARKAALARHAQNRERLKLVAV